VTGATGVLRPGDAVSRIKHRCPRTRHDCGDPEADKNCRELHRYPRFEQARVCLTTCCSPASAERQLHDLPLCARGARRVQQRVRPAPRSATVRGCANRCCSQTQNHRDKHRTGPREQGAGPWPRPTRRTSDAPQGPSHCCHPVDIHTSRCSPTKARRDDTKPRTVAQQPPSTETSSRGRSTPTENVGLKRNPRPRRCARSWSGTQNSGYLRLTPIRPRLSFAFAQANHAW
jgi:hypothetical protein